MYPWGGVTPPTPTPTPTGGGNDRLPVGRDRRAQELMVIAMWASGTITDEEMVALLAGL
jgi:hypothetical protein